MRRYHVGLVDALFYQVLLHHSQELADVRVALGHVLESLETVYLDQFLLEHLELLQLLRGDGEVALSFLQVQF